ncbi:hypothetical protein Taro_014642 [Colocasia esculenta]|uniref:Uncharacterized protein n=1 Tax=Colocasia esculenta TaxID=4460 RepID=A0A843UMF2_COLES|nr:hypothetical protein [Colocasia esculenta]
MEEIVSTPVKQSTPEREEEPRLGSDEPLQDFIDRTREEQHAEETEEVAHKKKKLQQHRTKQEEEGDEETETVEEEEEEGTVDTKAWFLEHQRRIKAEFPERLPRSFKWGKEEEQEKVGRHEEEKEGGQVMVDMSKEEGGQEELPIMEEDGREASKKDVGQDMDTMMQTLDALVENIVPPTTTAKMHPAGEKK